MSYYFLIILASISVPFLAGFDDRLKFYKNWKYLFPAMLVTMAVFIPWDMYKTALRVWGFNPDYLQGIYLYNLPLEEVLFFIAIPYACLFTYHSFEYFRGQAYLKIQENDKEKARKPFLFWSDKPVFFRNFTIALGVILIIAGLVNLERTYTWVTFISSGIFLLWHAFFVKGNEYRGMFYFTFLIILIPFFIVNGALTGLFTPEPVVWYDDTENLGIRLGTIPVEDTIYGMLLLFMNTTIYEALKMKKAGN